MADGTLPLPMAFDLAATGVSAVSGALVAARRRYDFVGAFALAFVTGVGGALIRDGVFLQGGPPAVVRDGRYVLVILAATFAGVAIDRLGTRLQKIFLVCDAVGLGVYAVVGADRSLAAGLSQLAAVLVGVMNAVGGGVLRDVLVRDEPLMFKPGQFYASAALVGSGTYVLLRAADAQPLLAAGSAVFAGLGLRLLAVRYDWRTPPLYHKHWPTTRGRSDTGA